MTSPGTNHSPAHRRFVDQNDIGPEPPRPVRRPEAEPLLRALAVRAVEVIAGARDIEQLARWVTDDVYAHLSVRASIAARARAVTGRVADRPRLWIDHVTTWPTDSGGVDAVIVVYDTCRAHVVSLRLEGIDRRWRATVIVII